MADTLIDFEIRTSPGNVLMFKGQLQNRVIRLNSTNRLAFGYRITSTQAGLNGSVGSFATAVFKNFATDVVWDPTSLGSIAPNLASRSADGSLITISFPSTNPVRSSFADSRFIYIDTDADHYMAGGTTKLIDNLDSGASVTLPTYQPISDSTPPVVAITSPDPLQCVCNPVTIIGTAKDPESFDHYVLEYASNPGGPWSLITSSTTPVSAGTLGVWDVSALPQGYYFIRLTAFNAVGLSSSVTTIVFVDKQFDTVDVRSPADHSILGGVICFDGTINDGNGNCPVTYTISWAPAGGGAYNPVDPGTPVYPGAVINDPLGSWNTRAGVPDGDYNLRVTGIDACGHTKSEFRKVTVDNTPPIGVITSPTNCASVDGVVAIKGTASDTHLAGWVLQYTGGDTNGWVTIATGNTSVTDGLLANWDTTALRRCAYTLRLIVSDAAGIDCSGYTNQAEYLVSVYVGVRGMFDYDGDGDVDMDDFGVFQRCFSGPSILAAPECRN